jgi:hypothetical protein
MEGIFQALIQWHPQPPATNVNEIGAASYLGTAEFTAAMGATPVSGI